VDCLFCRIIDGALPSTIVLDEPFMPPTSSSAVRPSADQSASMKLPAFLVTFRW
jgi:hypothetical protein